MKGKAFTEEELREYDKALDDIKVERFLLNDRYEKGQNYEKIAIAQKMLQLSLLDSQTIQFTGLSQEQVNSLKQKNK